MKPSEVNIMQALYKCGVLTKSSISKCDSDEMTVKGMISDRLIKREPFEVKGKKIAVFSLTKLGEKRYAELINKSYFFRCNNLSKAIAISYIYSKLPNSAKSTWQSKDELLADTESLVVPDAVYIENDTLKGVIVLKADEKEDKCMALSSFKQEKGISELTVITY